MTKAAICVPCMDIFAPYRSGSDWRWCACGHSGTRWRDTRGQLEVTSLHGAEDIRVLGLDNSFLGPAIVNPHMTFPAWRDLHQNVCKTADGYLFHADKRDCWALVVKVGESSDVFFIPYPEAKYGAPHDE